jgi:hypothetical protein
VAPWCSGQLCSGSMVQRAVQGWQRATDPLTTAFCARLVSVPPNKDSITVFGGPTCESASMLATALWCGGFTVGGGRGAPSGW